MATIYVKVDKPVKGKITLTKGKQADEEVNLFALYQRDGKQHTVDIRANVQLGNNEVEFEWDTTGVVLDTELFLAVKLMLTVGKGGHGKSQWKTIPVVLYRRTIEVLAVDENDAPVAGAGCRLRIHVDEGFEASSQKWREDYTVSERGEREWTHTTGDDGKVAFTKLPLGAVSIDWVPPYGLNPYGWKKEGEYTETGWKRKAEIRKMPIAHYVWWGDPTKEEYLVSATKTPNDVAQITETMTVYRSGAGLTFCHPPRILVMYWRQAIANTLAARLDNNIFQKPVTNLSEVMTEDGMAIHGVFMGRAKQLDAIIDTLSQYKMFSAVKDLVSLCVVYKHGGYYFDTTTLAPTDTHGLPDKLTAEAKDEIRFPATLTGGVYYFMRHLNSQFGTLSPQGPLMPESQKWISGGLDVWAMYAPPRHDALPLMIDSYIRRCVAFGLDKYPNNTLIDAKAADGYALCPYNGQTFHQFVTETCKPVKDDPATQFRNKLIGNLIIASVQEGLTTYAYELQQKTLPGNRDLEQEILKFLWKTSQPPADVKSEHVQAYLPEFGIPKAHSGSWRVQAAVAGDGVGD